MNITLDKNVFDEFVSHTRTLIVRHDRHLTSDLQSCYASDRLKQILQMQHFNSKRFSVQRSFFGTFTIWDTNTQSRHRDFKTRERLWAEAKCKTLNDDYEKTYPIHPNDSCVMVPGTKRAKSPFVSDSQEEHVSFHGTYG